MYRSRIVTILKFTRTKYLGHTESCFVLPILPYYMLMNCLSWDFEVIIPSQPMPERSNTALQTFEICLLNKMSHHLVTSQNINRLIILPGDKQKSFFKTLLTILFFKQRFVAWRNGLQLFAKDILNVWPTICLMIWAGIRKG